MLGSAEITHRFGYHPGTSVTIPKHEQARDAYKAFAEFLDLLLPDGRAKSSAFTKLQESSMWANYGIAELAPVEESKTIAATVKPSPPPNRSLLLP